MKPLFYIKISVKKHWLMINNRPFALSVGYNITIIVYFYTKCMAIIELITLPHPGIKQAGNSQLYFKVDIIKNSTQIWRQILQLKIYLELRSQVDRAQIILHVYVQLHIV